MQIEQLPGLGSSAGKVFWGTNGFEEPAPADTGDIRGHAEDLAFCHLPTGTSFLLSNHTPELSWESDVTRGLPASWRLGSNLVPLRALPMARMPRTSHFPLAPQGLLGSTHPCPGPKALSPPRHKKPSLTLHITPNPFPGSSGSPTLGCVVRHVSPTPYPYLKFWKIKCSPSHKSIACPLNITLKWKLSILSLPNISFSSLRDPSSPVPSSIPNFLNAELPTV